MLWGFKSSARSWAAVLSALQIAISGCGLNSDSNVGLGEGIQINAQTPPGVAAITTSTISASPGQVNNNGIATATVTITLRDSFNTPIPGVAVTFASNGSNNSITQPSSTTNSAGVAFGAIASTTAEFKTLSISSPSGFSGVQTTVEFVDYNPVAATSTITGVNSVVADGVATSQVTITIKNSLNQALAGFTPTFSASGSNNTYGACSATDASGISTCTLSSTKAETKTLQILTPVSKVGGAVTFVAGPAVQVNSSLSVLPGTGVVADNADYATVYITLKDAFNNSVGGVTPAFTVTGSGNALALPGATDANGQASGTVRSTIAEAKTVTLTSPAGAAGLSAGLTFVAGAPNASKSSLVMSPSSGVVADGSDTSTATITLKDVYSNVVTGYGITIAASGSNNTLSSTSLTTNAFGQATATLRSTRSESKTVSIVTPASLNTVSGAVVFVPGVPNAGQSNITASPSGVVADGSTVTTVTITLKDVNANPISGVIPTFSATDTGSTNGYGACSSSNSSGVSTCTLSSRKAETKTLQLLTPVSKTGGTVSFVNGSADSGHSSIVAAPNNVVADGSTTTTVTITLKDIFDNPLVGTTPTFSATDTGSTNVYDACTATNASGVSTCALRTTKAETKTLSIATPISMSGGAVTFIAGAAHPGHSSISASPVGGLIADGVSSSTITMTFRDLYDNPVSGISPTISSSNGSDTVSVPSASNASGQSTATISATVAEAKTVSITSPAGFGSTNVTFIAGATSSANSTILGTGPIVADGSASSTVTITLKDGTNNPVAGVTPTFSATDTGSANVYGACSATDGSGVSTCTLRSTKAENKTLSIATPVTKAGTTISFTPGAANAGQSDITASPSSNVVADGATTTTVTITLRDVNANPISGTTPTFSATDTGSTNIYGACSVTDVSGVSTCTLRSSKAETKTLSIQTPIVKGGGTVGFIAGAPDSGHSSIAAAPNNQTADGSTTSTVTITLRDVNNNPVIGTSVSFSSSGGSDTLVQPPATNASGQAVGTIKTTVSGVKTLTITAPVAVNTVQTTVTFVPGAVNAGQSSITAAPNNVVADGTTATNVTITLRDVNANPISGTTPTFSATDTGSTNVYGVCSATDGSGVSTCTLKATKAETKTLSIVTPVAKSGGTITFIAGSAHAGQSSISGSPSSNVIADGSSSSSITITLRDVNANPISGTTPTFSATDTGSGNAYGACSSSDASGVSICTLKSTRAETKTLSIQTPVVKSGGTVGFIPGGASLANCSISASPTNNVVADGTTTTTVTITLKDANNNSLTGTVPTFTATDTGSTNVYGTCSAANASGVSTCTLKSTKAEAKTLSITSPAGLGSLNAAVTFVPGAASTSCSTISAFPGTSVTADGSALSTITITLKDVNCNAISGVTPALSVSGTGNTLSSISATDTNGQSTPTLKSTVAQTKTISITSPASVNTLNTTAQFVAGSPSAVTSTISGAPSSLTADGSSSSTVTITLKDANNNPVNGVTTTFTTTTLTGADTLTQPASNTNASGVATGAIRSTKAEAKTLNINLPAGLTSVTGAVTFVAGAPVVGQSSISASPTSNVLADGNASSTVTVTLKDAFGNPVNGATVVISSTGTGNTLTQPPVTNTSGQAAGTIQSTVNETKTISITTPAGFGALTASVTFIGWSLEVPIEMMDIGITARTTATTWARTRTNLDPADYDGTVSYASEAVCVNTEASAMAITILDSGGVTRGTINVPAGTVNPTRFTGTLVPAAASNYRFRTPASPTGGLICYSARLLVRQTNAMKTKIYIPLIGAAYNVTNSDNSNAAAGVDSTTGTVDTQTATANYSVWKKDLSKWGTLDPTAPFTLEAVTSASSGGTRVTLYNKTANAAVSNALVTGNTTINVASIDFLNTETNFTDGDDFEVRIKRQGGTAGQAARIYKAGLWVVLTRVDKAEIYYRVSRSFSTSATTVYPQARAMIDLSRFINPNVYFEAVGLESVLGSSDVAMRTDGVNESGSGSSDIGSSNIDFGSATKARIRSGALSITSGDRFIPRANMTSGTLDVSSAFVVISWP